MKKALIISMMLALVTFAFGWDLLRQAQFPTNFYALDRVNTTMWAAGYVGGFAKSIDNGNSWTFLPSPAYDPVTPSYKDINDIDFYSELNGVMVSADGLVGITADGGATWTTPTQTQTIFGTDDVNACVYLPSGQIWVAGWGGKIAYSWNHGASWTQQTTGLTDQIYSISVNSDGFGFCAMHRGTPNQSKILTTNDFGTTWTVQDLTITGNPHLYKVRQFGSTVVLAGSLGYIGVSNDNGVNWTHHVNAGGSTTNMQDIVLSGQTGYAVGWNGVLLRTNNGFNTYETVTNNFGLYFEGLNILPNGDLITAGWNGAIAKSTNQGAHWTDLIANAVDLFSGKVIDENTWYFVGDKGYIIKTTDGGQTFNRVHIPNNFDIYYSCFFKNANEGIVSGRTIGKFFRTTNGGTDWMTFTVPGVTTTQIYYDIFFINDLIGYAVGSNNINAKTTDGGATWTMLNGTGLGTSILYCTYFKTENNGFAGSGAGQLFITQNGGQSWTPITVGSTTAQIRDIWFKDANIGVLVNSVGEIFYTLNGGLNATDWTAGVESCLDDMNGVWCDSNGVFWAAGYSSDNVTTNIGNSWSIVKSTDNGATWTQETFPALTFNSTRFQGITGSTGKVVAYGRNNLLVAQDLGGVNPPTYATNLFISEYVEGTSYQKAIEIFNGTGAAVDLSAYTLKKQTNGAGPFASDLVLSGILQHNDVYVIVNSTTGGTNLAGQPYVDLATTSQAVNFNGNDAVALYHNGVQIDVVGIVDQVENWGIDVTLVRNSNIASPTVNFSFADWTSYPVNTFTYLGSHTFTPSGDPVAAAPNFTPPAGVYTAPINVTLSSTTGNATIYYTTNGDIPTVNSSVYTTPIPVSVTTTIRAMATAPGHVNSSIASATYTFPVSVANLAALRALPADNTTIYTLTGGVVLTFKQTFRNQKYVQDGTAAILIDDLSGVITSVYNVWDGISGLTGKLSEFGGMLQFVPTLDPGPATSNGNIITPQVITLNDLNTNFEAYESELVKVLGCTFPGATGNFANGIVYPINDGTATYNFRTTFYDVDYIGQPIPVVPMDLVGIPNSRTDGSYFTSRSQADIQTPQGDVAAPVFSPPAGTYYNPIQVTMTTTTPDAVIRYTLDGSIPTATSTLYSTPISINATTTVKAIAFLGAQYSAVSAATYTFPVEIATVAQLRQQTLGTTIYKLTGEVVLTFQQIFRNQKFIQDTTAGVLIDDFNGIITTPYNVGDGITGICGTLGEYGGMLQFVPTINSPAATSSGNAITPVVISFQDFILNFEDYESRVVQLNDVQFNTNQTVFANGTSYGLISGAYTINFRTTFYDVDYIGTNIPTGSLTLIGIPNSRTEGNFITSRNLNDFVYSPMDPPTLLAVLSLVENNVTLIWAPGPVPVEQLRNWENLTALKVYRNNVLIATITDFLEYEMASYLDANLPNGSYEYYVTNVYFNQFESGPSNTVTVEITSNDDNYVVPAELTALTGNYPNPFNPETTITYSVKTPSPVNISIYNLKGEKVRTLVNANKANGFYKTVWDGKDDSGRAVTSGIYLYRMQAENYISTRRMMLMK